MSFLDNLENNLNALERIEERDPDKIKRDRERQEEERQQALRRAPNVDALKTSEFTSNLLTQCRTIGREHRVLVRFTWIGENLRLDAAEKRMELVPTADGVEAVCSANGVESKRTLLTLDSSDPEALVREWLA